jgi:hypothetical protein
MLLEKITNTSTYFFPNIPQEEKVLKHPHPTLHTLKRHNDIASLDK